jgi:hypothetical protein
MAEKSSPSRYRWRCKACGVSGEIPYAAWMSGEGKLKWGPAILNEIMSEHGKQSPGCPMADLDLSLIPK